MADGDLQITFRPRHAALAEVRRELAEWLDEHETPGSILEELVLAADELCANAIDATGDPHDVIALDVRYDGSAVHLAVSNAGHAPVDLSRPEEDPVEDKLLDRGRGLDIVRAFTDSLAIVNVDGRTVARAVRLLPS